MRILLAASASYEPPKGGSTRSNLVWLRALARLGHSCRVVSGAEPGGATGLVRVDGIEIERHAGLTRDSTPVRRAVDDFQPDFVLVSSEDLSHVLLRESFRAAPSRLVYLAHTPQWFPFGPEAWHADREAADMVREALAVVAIGHHMAAYIAEHLGRTAKVIHPSLYGVAPWPNYNNFGRGKITIINPSQVKGLPVFLELARRNPQLAFEALRGWGTTNEDLAALRSLGNVQVTEPVREIDEVLARTQILLAPSLWYEGYGLVATEAMLRGVPVIAADYGGLAESAAASRYRRPVAPIRSWTAQMDSTGMPVAELDSQPVAAWDEALQALTLDHHEYERERKTVQAAAADFVAQWRDTDLADYLGTLRPKRRRILLIHNSTYFPASGGGDKSNRLLLEALVQEGHTVEVFTRLERFGEEMHTAYRAQLAGYGIETTEHAGGLSFVLGGLRIHAITREANLRAAFRAAVDEFRPDVFLASTDDPAHLFLDIALDHKTARVVYLVRATVALPFGPDASTQNEERTARLHRADAVVGVSHYVSEYCRTYADLDAVHVPISLSDDPHPPLVGAFENEFVTLVNPSGVKGLPVLLQLADRMPEIAFAAVPSWGTTAEDLAELRRRPNMTILDRADDITEILRRTRVTLVPSLWAEARSRVVLESLSRGVPVLASDVGGLREAMCGMDYVLPVNPITRYKQSVSDQMAPDAIVPPQDVRHWEEALRRLTRDGAHWLELSQTGRAAAMRYIDSLSVKPLETIVERSTALPKRAQQVESRPGKALSPARRKLLHERIQAVLRERKSRYFPVRWGLKGGAPQIVLLPWAGAGGQSWRFLEAQLKDGFELLPAVLPQREGRAAYTEGQTFAGVAEEIAKELNEALDFEREIILAGHSMGSALAYEVALRLRRGADRLVVSSCRAPQLRLHLPPVEVGELSGPDALGADLALFDAYRPSQVVKLDCAITAHWGTEEPSLSLEQVHAWAELTGGPFDLRTHEGGHFWLKERPEEFGSW